MSVLIKGMEMPARCRACGFAGYGGKNFELNVCLFTGKSQPTLSPERMPDCPLFPVPDHGRLIDADALITVFREMESIDWNNKAAPYSWAYAYESIEDDIDNAPTIIPAEEEDDG